jgi:SAM-dependent methyltransferase
MTTYNEDWEEQALSWAAWARTPGHDVYWHFSGPTFFELVPPPGRHALEVGCGEGRVCRDLAARGHRVVGLDASPTLLGLAAEADPEGEYVLGDAAALPFEDGAFDLVVAFNSLMDVQDMPAAVAEAARVLEPGGRFCVCVTHPIADAGSFESREPDARFVIDGSYYGRRRFEGTFARNGLEVTFHGWCYPLEDYFRALEDAGFLIESVREPRYVSVDGSPDRWNRLPNFLQLRALKR